MQCYGIFLASSMMYLSVVWADRNVIIKKMIDNETWISVENFETTIKASFNVARCANIFISGKSVGTENLFNTFVRIYKYEYTVNKRIYDCNGYFMISTSARRLVNAMEKVPTTISTTELLVVVDDDVEESTGLFNVSMYANANVNIAARNGIWTLSENFLDPRVFKKVSRHDAMIHKQGVVDLQGRNLQIAAFYLPPFCYLRTTVNRTFKGIEGEFFTAENRSEVDGIEMNLFMLIANRLNFTWTIRKPNHFYRYGRQNGSTWNGGMIGQLFRKEVDMAFTGIWMTFQQSHFVNLTKPWTLSHIHFLVPRPKPLPSIWALTRPLSPEVWYAVLGIVILQSLFVYTAAWSDTRTPKRFRSFMVTWTEMMGRLLGTCAPRKMGSLKLQFQLWHIIGVLIVTAYSSSLAASLASSGWEDRIDTLQQFLAANLSWGREGPVPNFNLYFDDTDPYASQFWKHFQHESSEDERHERLAKGNYAVVGTVIASVFFPENHIRNEALKGLRLMKQQLGEFYASFAVQPWLLEPVDTVMLWLRESGLVAYHIHDVLHRLTGSALRDVLTEHDGNEEGARPLQLIPLVAGFCLYFFGLLISTVVFYFELKSVSVAATSVLRNKHKHIDDVQTASVDEHFEMLFKDRGVIDPEPSEVEFNDLPEWYDDELFRAGQRYYQRNMLSMGLAGMMGLLAVIVIPSILKVLIYTKQSGTVCTAFKRYLETVMHIHFLYTTDIKTKDSNWWKSINTIRWKHSTSSRRSNKSGHGAITQRDMALTQFGFIGYAFLQPKKLSLTNEAKEREGLNHFWRVVGHCLGITDRMNLCRRNEAETTELCGRLMNEVFAKHMKDSPANFEHMAALLIDGLWSIDFSLDNDAFMYLWYDLSEVKYHKKLGWSSWFNMQYRATVLLLLRIPIVGYFVRTGFNQFLKCNYWIARNYPVIAWIRFGKTHATINLYPTLTKH